MNKNIAIEFEGVGKQYRLGLVGTGSLQHDINRWWQTTVMRREDPYLRVGEVNDRATKGNSDYVWALKDISFKVEKGDVVGIIGKNGAGKSTLLKLLSHITAPSTGHIRYRGRIASLLEVGTGFVGDLTARQNIYMNGSIMGMSKREITAKLDEIIDFAGIERYIDTPVKRFSSGMYVRLGFAVAAHLEPEILVVDEVLAVGDAEFQKKAIGKMQDVSKGQGRTVLFVSHNMAAVRNLCKTGVILKNGLIQNIGKANDIVDEYISDHKDNITDNLANWKKREGNGIAKFLDVFITDRNGEKVTTLLTGGFYTFNFQIEVLKPCTLNLGFSFFSVEDVMISNLYSQFQHELFSVTAGIITIKCSLEDFAFSTPTLLMRGVIMADGQLADWPSCHLQRICVLPGDFYGTGVLSRKGNQFLFKGKWNVILG